MMLRRRSANPYRIGAAVCKVCCADGDAQIIRLYATMDDLGSAEDRASITGGGHVGLDNYGRWAQAGMRELFGGNVFHAGIEANFGCGLRHHSGERADLRSRLSSSVPPYACYPKCATSGLQLPEHGWPALIGVLIGDRACPAARLGRAHCLSLRSKRVAAGRVAGRQRWCCRG